MDRSPTARFPTPMDFTIVRNRGASPRAPSTPLPPEASSRRAVSPAARRTFPFKLPGGYRHSDDRTPAGHLDLIWPHFGLELMIAPEDVAQRQTLFPRFQLFRVDESGEIDGNAVIRTESFDALLGAFHAAKGERR